MQKKSAGYKKNKPSQQLGNLFVTQGMEPAFTVEGLVFNILPELQMSKIFFNPQLPRFFHILEFYLLTSEFMFV